MVQLDVGLEFAGYRIEELIARGGMGVVYRATQLTLGRRVALKLIAPELADDMDFRVRFQRESRLAASIDHPNVIPIYEAGEAEGQLFLAMRYVDGTDFHTIIRQFGKLQDKAVVHIASQMAGALDAAHENGLVHRDVKPANVMIVNHDVGGHAYLTDFGLSKRTSSQSAMTKTGQWLGTLDYVAPEQITGQRVDARADVYALGCVLFEALTGSVPYPRDSDVAKIWAHVQDPPAKAREITPELSPQWDTVLTRAMAKQPAERYQSAGDFARAAVATVESKPVTEPERTVAAGAAAPLDVPTAPASTAPPRDEPTGQAIPEVERHAEEPSPRAHAPRVTPPVAHRAEPDEPHPRPSARQQEPGRKGVWALVTLGGSGLAIAAALITGFPFDGHSGGRRAPTVHRTSASPQLAGVPTATTRVQAEVPRLQAALRVQATRSQRDCNSYKGGEAIGPLLHSALTGTQPGRGYRQGECLPFLANYRFAQLGQSAQFYSAAITDGVTARQGSRKVVVIWVLDYDNTFKVVSISEVDSAQVGGPPTASKPWDDSANRFVQALRLRDCRTATLLLHKNLQFSCDQFVKSAAALVAGLRNDQSIKPVRLGWTKDLGFYSLRYSGGRVVTIVMATQPDRKTGRAYNAITDVIPVTYPAERDLARLPHLYGH